LALLGKLLVATIRRRSLSWPAHEIERL